MGAPKGPRTHPPAKPFEADLLDRAILRALPEEGATIGKYLAKTLSAPALRSQVDPELPISIFSNRLRMLHAYGYVAQVKTSGAATKGFGWQRTGKGAELLMKAGE